MEAELTLTQLEVRGTIPPALSGRYLRIGPNPVDADPASYHWFTGDGMVHGLALSEGKAHWYRNRWIASQANAAARGTMPAPEPHHGPTDTVNTNVVDLAGRTFALVEGSSYAWNPAHRARVGLIPRDGDQHAIIWCNVDPAYVFHVANAYDLPDGRVVLDVCAYPTMFAGTPGGPDATSRGLERWTLDPATGTTTIRTIDAAPQEFPRIDERRFGQAYRYSYTMAVQADRRFQSAGRLYKYDLVEGVRQVHDFGAGRHPGEFVFVPAHADAGEDEGWLIGFVIDEAGDTTELVILDAANFDRSPVATVRLLHRIPPGFHGNWINGGGAQ
jgi:carotenoid cleavage dioxygenase-like enzyme